MCQNNEGVAKAITKLKKGKNLHRTMHSRQLSAKGSTQSQRRQRVCVSATVRNNILYINNIELALFHRVPFEIGDFSRSPAGFARMDFGAGNVEKELLRIEIGVYLPCPNSKVESNGEQRGILSKNSKENRWIS